MLLRGSPLAATSPAWRLARAQPLSFRSTKKKRSPGSRAACRTVPPRPPPPPPPLAQPVVDPADWLADPRYAPAAGFAGYPGDMMYPRAYPPHPYMYPPEYAQHAAYPYPPPPPFWSPPAPSPPPPPSPAAAAAPAGEAPKPKSIAAALRTPPEPPVAVPPPLLFAKPEVSSPPLALSPLTEIPSSEETSMLYRLRGTSGYADHLWFALGAPLKEDQTTVKLWPIHKWRSPSNLPSLGLLRLREIIEAGLDLASVKSMLAAPVELAREEFDRSLALPFQPNGRPPLCLAIGLNYKTHAQETKMPVPTLPLVFMKNHFAAIPTGRAIERPRHVVDPDEMDYEVELAVVIGKPCKNVLAKDAMDYVLGYTVVNDVTARRWQGRKGGGQWTRSKGFDTFLPIGPGIRLADPKRFDPSNVTCSSYIKKKRAKEFVLLQQDSTKNLLFDVPRLIEFLSQGTELPAWTVIATGTPMGVGYTRVPPVCLQDGDLIRVEVEGIGSLTNPVTDI